MTSKETRNLGYLAWQDPWAWMESMKGSRWLNLIKEEKQAFNKLSDQPYVEKLTRQFEKELKGAKEYTKQEGFSIAGGVILISEQKGYKYLWRWAWKKQKTLAYDIDIIGNIVWYVTTDDNTHYKNRLICESIDGKHIWTKPAISYQIAVKDDKCYYIKLQDYFRTIELCMCNAHTGKQEDVLYIEKDDRRDLILIKQTNKTLYLKSVGRRDTKLWRIDGNKLIPMDTKTVLQLPLGESIYGDHCRLVKSEQLQRKWKAIGKPVEDWIFPEGNPEWISLQTGLVLTMNEGRHSIWFCAPHKKPHNLINLPAGEISPNMWTSWENALIQSFFVKSPLEVPYTIHIVNNKVIKQINKIEHSPSNTFKELDVHRLHAKSNDGTSVPYVVVHQKDRAIKGLLVYVYGAYGSSTPVGWPYQNWYPILERGWAVAYAFVRGGGDNDFAWADLARRENRHRAIEDFEAVIKGAQRFCKADAKHTVIYGRSAGGVPVGAVVSKYPNGELIGAAYAEVPYVDVLRTSSNPDLPLTIGEYDEFGNPLERVMNFKELLSVSPVNTLPTGGAPGVFVLARTGLLDRQVYAYEPFKWIQKLRGYGSIEERDKKDQKGKFITYEANEAHQYSPDKFIKARAVDLAILVSWMDGKLTL